ncbi:hypothetical protein K8354_15285 [Polaribacter litorisediminis]|uniref:hypothetical protein n=1 Tax=Polaribacter litorisediminis TaxID=1908341 RepID=UPI001CBB8703|nr:hypothetical protein [Polaribacter litorisediminis]UAM97648.1 hypothetical protein K8354_15285 [Polaribacter litorisediminis]
MKTKNIFSMLLVILAFSKCGSAKFDKNPPFQITSAVVQNWYDEQQGIQGKSLKITYTSNKMIQFDSVFFDKRSTDLQVKHTNESKLVLGYFKSKEKQDLILDENPVKEFQNAVPILKEMPFQLKDNEAVISYRIKGKKKYFKIIGIEKE